MTSTQDRRAPAQQLFGYRQGGKQLMTRHYNSGFNILISLYFQHVATGGRHNGVNEVQLNYDSDGRACGVNGWGCYCALPWPGSTIHVQHAYGLFSFLPCSRHSSQTDFKRYALPLFFPQSKAQILDMRLVQLVTQVQMITFLCHQCQKYANTFSFRIFHQKIWAAQQSYPTSHCRTKSFTLGHSLCIGNMCHHLLHGTSTVTVSLFCVLIEQVKACLFNI